MKNRPIQYFSEEHLKNAKNLSKEEILEFLESFKSLFDQTEKKRKLISIRIPEDLLTTFRLNCDLLGIRYQTRIIELIRESLGQINKSD